MPEFKIMKYFKHDHLPDFLQVVSKPFCELAQKIVEEGPNTDIAEKTVALRKLLEAKDAAVRCFVK
jgi:hypothetical protein